VQGYPGDSVSAAQWNGIVRMTDSLLHSNNVFK
jgi:hypothetical protein